MVHWGKVLLFVGLGAVLTAITGEFRELGLLGTGVLPSLAARFVFMTIMVMFAYFLWRELK
jgi:hypothetical protein